MKYRVFKFLFEIKVNLAPYFFVQIDQIQSKTLSLLTKSTTSIISLKQFTFGFINFYLGWMTPTPKIWCFK